MNEMLGNQYFLARRFEEAMTQFERTLLLDPNNQEVKKKLIICYIQQSEIKLALKLFTDLISENIEIILTSDAVRDDCPCQQMICDINNSSSNLNESEKNITLGILWLFCDKLKSIKYFNELLASEPNNSEYQIITNIINQQFPIN